MSPEEKKAMEDMGVKLPSMNGMPQLTDQQIQDAIEVNNRIVPLKDNARIASISKIPLTNQAMPAYLQSVHGKLLTELDPYIIESGDKIFQWAKNEYHSTDIVGNMAVGLKMMGKPPIALYLLSIACKDNPTDADNLNNYSALLLMAGAEQLALPILNKLNKEFPQNSTILNNIGQAWFGLGEIDKAEKYLDSTIRICANHSQANLTKSLIEESKGNTEAAIDAIKHSIKQAYTTEKESRLDKLGYKLNKDDLNWDRPMPQDPLGLEKFNWPAYPTSVENSMELEKEWDAFRKSCSIELEKLETQEDELVAVHNEVSQIRTQKLMQAGQKGEYASLFPPLAYKAFVKLKYLVDDSDGHSAFTIEQKTDAMLNANKEVDNIAKTLEDRYIALNKVYENQFGEGKENPFTQACSDYNGVANDYLSSANTLLEKTQGEYLEMLRHLLNNQIYYDQYTKWPDEFEVAKVMAKQRWLATLAGLKVEFDNPSYYCIKGEEAIDRKFTLPQFEDIHCAYHSELDLGIGTIVSDCSTLTGKIDLKILKDVLKIEVLKLGIKLKQRDNSEATFFDQFERFSGEIGLKKGFGVGTGPLKAEAKVGGSGFVEIDRNGFADGGLIISADIKVGTNFVKPLDGIKGIEVIGADGIKKAIDHSMGPAKDLSVTIAGIDAKIAINAGFTVEGKFLGKTIKSNGKK
jgi:tetratricopeptide (TPR) repeat protein